ncbi:MAG: hypothetical protein HQK76_12145 [Desulfobacterales bacterium]|nr:hypothetical protein [Desulfobacterales bacterium]
MKKAVVLLITFLLCVFFTGNALAVEFDELGSVSIHGFLSQGYMKSDEYNFMAKTDEGTFQFNELGINFSTDLSDRLRMGVQLFSRDLGPLGNDVIEVDWAFADYRWKDWMGLRIGRIKVPYGLYNETRDIDMLRTYIFLPQGFYNEAWRDTFTSQTGAGIYGDVGSDMTGYFSYQAMTGVMRLPPTCGLGRSLEGYGQVEATKSQSDAETSYAVAMQWTPPLQGLRLGSTYMIYGVDVESAPATDFFEKKSAAAMLSYLQTYKSDPVKYASLAPLASLVSQGNINGALSMTNQIVKNTAGVDLNVNEGDSLFYEVDLKTTSFSLEYVWENLIFASEISKTNFRMRLHKLDKDFSLVMPTSFTNLGYYGSLSYRFTNWFEAGFYYTEYYASKDDKEGKKRNESTKALQNDEQLIAILQGQAKPEISGLSPYVGWLKDYTLALKFDISFNWTCKLEMHKMNGGAVMMVVDNPNLGDDSATEEDWYLFAAKMTFNF